MSLTRRQLLASTAVSATTMAAAGSFPAPAIAQSEPIKVGYLPALTGPSSSTGVGINRGVQLGIEAGKRRLNKPDLGQFKGELPACAVTREFRVDSVDGMTLGQTLDVSLFSEGDLVDVTGVSKGKGFAGTIKRHSFARGPETHGADHHREPGSIGAGTTPGRVYRGTRMAGHMGVERVTVLKMKIVRSDGERNLLLIKGSVPGAKNALVAVSKAEQI